jgi:hypothetical protein
LKFDKKVLSIVSAIGYGAGTIPLGLTSWPKNEIVETGSTIGAFVASISDCSNQRGKVLGVSPSVAWDSRVTVGREVVISSSCTPSTTNGAMDGISVDLANVALSRMVSFMLEFSRPLSRFCCTCVTDTATVVATTAATVTAVAVATAALVAAVTVAAVAAAAVPAATDAAAAADAAAPADADAPA